MRILPASEYAERIEDGKSQNIALMWVSAFCFILLDVGVVLGGPDPL
jgi:hypothetical protein